MSRTLLMVDDDATTRDLLSLLLSNAGWTVTTAADGAVALQSLRSGEAPTVVLCDLQMPGLCGTPLAHAVSAAAPSTVILAMTATAQPATPAGYAALLIKPFKPEMVWQHYNAAMQGSHLAPANAKPSSQVEAPVLDPAVLEQLQATMPPERVHALLSFVADDAENRIARMRAAADKRDDAAFRTEAHALKGSCGMVGAMSLRKLAEQAENVGLSKTSLTEWNLFTEFVQTNVAFRVILNSLSRGVI